MQTEIFNLKQNDEITQKNAIKKSAEVILAGGLVVFPTETVYGLGGHALDPLSAKKIYQAKGRPSDNPLIIHIAFPRDAEKYASLPPMYHTLAESFMPGPLTVVLDAKDSVPNEVRAGLPTVAVRCPCHPLAHDFLLACGVGIAAPSANLSGSPSPTTGEHCIADMSGRVDVILDGGECSIGVESTIVRLHKDNSLTLLRPGAITLEDLKTVTPNITVADAVLGELKEGETALSPGMKHKHYAPRTKLVLLDGTEEERFAYIHNRHAKDTNNTSIGVLLYDEEKSYQQMPNVTPYSIGKKRDIEAQAHRLFSLLRETDKGAHTVLYAPLPLTEGLGMALYNRLIRAAAHTIVSCKKKNSEKKE